MCDGVCPAAYIMFDCDSKKEETKSFETESIAM